MILYGIAFIAIYAVRSTTSVGIKIEGLIDLGPKWSYEYKVLPIAYSDIVSKVNELSYNKSLITNIRKDNENDVDVNDVKKAEADSKSIEKVQDNPENKHTLTNDKEVLVNAEYSETSQYELNNVTDNATDVEITKGGVRGRSTQIYSEDDEKKSKQLRKKENRHKYRLSKLPDRQMKNKKNKRKVKDDIKIHSFNDHISKQSLKVFDNWKKNTDSIRTKTKIDMLQNSFIDKFSGFLKQNENYILRTKLAPQKVVVNLMDTANKMMQRCINYLEKDEEVARNLNIYSLHKELKRQNEIESIHACKILGACRTNDEYTEFILNILTSILQTDNTKVQQASNAITEVVKSNDLSNILDAEAEKKIHKSIDAMEHLNPISSRAMLLIFRNVLLSRNKPIFIMNNLDKNVAQRTEALHNLMDLLNKHMNTVENKKEWRQIEKEVTGWKNGNHKDIQASIEKIFKQLKRTLEKLGSDVKDKINEYIKILRSKLRL